MALFGRGKKKKDAEAAKPTARAGPDVFSPFWSSWPAPEAPAPPAPAPPVPTAEVPLAAPIAEPAPPIVEPAPPIVEPPPPPPVQPNPTPIEGPPVVVTRVRVLSDPPPARAPAPTPPPRRAADERQLEPLDRILVKSLPDEWLSDMALDSKIAFLLSLVDGVSTIDDVLDGCGMDRTEAVSILVELLEESVLEARPQPPRPRTSRPPR